MDALYTNQCGISTPNRGIPRAAREWCNSAMENDIAESRRRVLRALVERDGLGEVSRRSGKPNTQINDMLSDPPRKPFGERVAMSIERAYEKTRRASTPPSPTGWLVNPPREAPLPGQQPSGAEVERSDALGAYISDLWPKLSAKDQRELLAEVIIRVKRGEAEEETFGARRRRDRRHADKE